VWVESGWQNRLDEEARLNSEREKMKNINVVVSLGNIYCDVCGKHIAHATKYCIDANDKSMKHPLNATLAAGSVRGKRYCEVCAIQRGYLKLIENSVTKARYFARGCADRNEHIVDSKLGVYTPTKEEHHHVLSERCPACNQWMILMAFDSDVPHHMFSLMCDDWACTAFRSPQKYIDVRMKPGDKPVLKSVIPVLKNQLARV